MPSFALLLYMVGKGTVPTVVGLGVIVSTEVWWTACTCMLLHKARMPFWFGFVPAVRVWKLCKVAFGHGAWCLPLFFPVIGIVWKFRTYRALAVRYGMSRLFGTCMFFVPAVFYSWLAFSPGVKCASGALVAEGRARDARGYSGGGSVVGLYDDPGQGSVDLAKEELKRRMEARRNRQG